MNGPALLIEPIEPLARDAEDAPEMCLHAVSPRHTPELLPGLIDAVDQAHGWVLQRSMISPYVLQMRVETQGRALIDLYAALMEQGLELSRESHVLLMERCTCARLDEEARGGVLSFRLLIALPSNLPTLFAWSAGGSA